MRRTVLGVGTSPVQRVFLKLFLLGPLGSSTCCWEDLGCSHGSSWHRYSALCIPFGYPPLYGRFHRLYNKALVPLLFLVSIAITGFIG